MFRPVNFWLKTQVPRHHVALKHLYGPNCPSGLPKHLLQTVQQKLHSCLSHVNQNMVRYDAAVGSYS